MKPGDLQSGPSISILRALKLGPGDTISLASQLGLTRRQVKCSLQYLVTQGRVVRMGTVPHPGVLGRPPVLFAIKSADALQQTIAKAAAILRSAGYTVLAPGEQPRIARAL